MAHSNPLASGITPDLPVSSIAGHDSLASHPAQSSAAIEFVARPRFHRRLTLPATESHPELAVTYAVAGLQSDTAPAVLFITGMMGTRYLATFADYLGERFGFRVAVVDRPGMGGSTNVEVSQRITVWLETVPALMKELKVHHMSIVAHSCGAIYALNTIHSMPEILPSARPALYLFSPWVAPKQSGVKLLSAASKIPSLIINQTASVISFINRFVAPPISFSSTAISSATSLFGSLSPEQQLSEQPKEKRDDLCQEFLGMSAQDASLMLNETMRRIWKEDTSGANGEALLSLRKPNTGSWGICDDYESCPAVMSARMKQHFPDKTVNIRVFWAETDMMIGKGGEEFFDNCFRDFAHGDARGDVSLVYQRETVPETNHETLCLPQYGAMSKVFEEIQQMYRSSQ